MTALPFRIVYLAGTDRTMILDLERAVRERRLSNGWIQDYVDTRNADALTAADVAEAIGRIEGELDRCLALLGRSADRTEAFGASLDDCVRDVPPRDLASCLVDLARRMIGHSRLAESEMRQSHARVGQLRTTLRVARRAAEVDHLTGLLNRRGFERIYAEWRGSGRSGHATLGLCDLDNFKAVNDRFGHETGDRVLKLVADALAALADHGHVVARLGGEELALLLADHTLEQAAEEVDVVRRSLARVTWSTAEPAGRSASSPSRPDSPSWTAPCRSPPACAARTPHSMPPSTQDGIAFTPR